MTPPKRLPIGRFTSGEVRPRGRPTLRPAAALFAFWSEDLIRRWTSDGREQARWHDLALDWIRIIDHHHGALDDMTDRPPWDQTSARTEHAPAALLATCDRDGLDAFVRKHFPEIRVALDDFERWSRDYDEYWGYRQGTARGVFCEQGQRDGTMDALGLRLAELGARLIYADRCHAADWEPVSLLPGHAEKALGHFEVYCRKKADRARSEGVSEALLRARGELQTSALEAYRQDHDAHLLTLLLPTGYGKTLAGLRVALEAVRSGRCRRIVYVAPYISILSQSARVLEKATGLRVALHHQMSILTLAEAGLNAVDPTGRSPGRGPSTVRYPGYLASDDRGHDLQSALPRVVSSSGSAVPADPGSRRGLSLH